MSDEDVTAVDWRGNFIEVGNSILYPRMSGRSCEMQEGTVTKIWAIESQRWNRETLEYEPYTAYKYRIKPTRSSRNFGRYSKADREVTVHIGENVTAAPWG